MWGSLEAARCTQPSSRTGTDIKVHLNMLWEGSTLLHLQRKPSGFAPWLTGLYSNMLCSLGSCLLLLPTDGPHIFVAEMHHLAVLCDAQPAEEDYLVLTGHR